ncbi:MAG: hypothetical protein LBU11_09785 [Zoogloeaceae bacterium]|jgi:hypothetical protein|nr:hypothetical protein [Zoogloeaceae bacterium]
MNYLGLTDPLPVNRPLTKQETEQHLSPSKPVPTDFATDWMATIKMNSTYLEFCDMYYDDKGFLTLVMLSFSAVALGIPLVAAFAVMQKWPDLSEQEHLKFIMAPVVLSVMAIPAFWLFFHALSKEIFRYTHYPMRFNRKTRMAHVFRVDGTVMSESWDKLYFTVSPGQTGWLDIHGHRLAEDGVTVLETFALPEYSTEIGPHLFRQWEFVRQYMEEGPEKLLDKVVHTVDIADKKESFWFGFWYMMRNNYQFIVAGWLMSPFTFACALGRWLAIKTSKIPVWPAEIEAECQVDPNDPCIRDAQHPHPDRDRKRYGCRVE